ncbi:MAG: 1-(5-phosphoribosyl)-5-[(5-phosphoribosylamino)methylideneamino]imidazole-4-carboxamide isomerase [Candidatus Omnitrophica bacterium]|nr:1-(5-phosphoribosyl)-5-[(5-phosphoribosylamino)methylideneamino]imidazole-4-carboxamide isomerase [Candidatus Omnitrophota bacterium]
MIIIPAIDLKDGNVVRLFQGKLDASNVYSHSPVTIARHWQKQGAQLIHVVDLDGAFSGEIKNWHALKEIIKSVDVPIEFGGGVRSLETINSLFESGVSRVVLGTKAAEDRVFLKKAFEKFQQRIIVSIDAKKGKVLTEGWQSAKKDLSAVDFACQLKEIGFAELIYTDILKDGTLQGPNFEGIKNIFEKSGCKVVASGGVSSLDDISRLKDLERDGVVGVIIGKALYEEKFSLKEAISLSDKKGGVK